MDVCIAYVHGKPVMLSLDEENIVSIDGEAQAMRGVNKEMLQEFSQAVSDIPYTADEEGYKALVNAKRVAFIASLLGHAVGDECVDKLSHILDNVHYEVLTYLGEIDDA